MKNRMFLIILLFVYACSDGTQEHSSVIQNTEDVVEDLTEVNDSEDTEDGDIEDVGPLLPDPCIECKMYFCPPLDSIWQKQICMNICEDPQVLVSETECTEFMECDPTQYLIGSQECTTPDGYPGTQDKVCNKGKIQYTQCVTECTEEACNGLDDDCDEQIDEGQLNECGECGIVPAEICDNVDNNCDGYTDEDLFQTCVTACGSGYEICDEGNWVSCSAPQPQDEICDGLDNDCDGQIDEELECICTIQDIGTLFPCEEAPLACGQGYKTCECTDPSCAEIVTTPCYALCYWIPGVADPCDPLVGMPLEDEKCNNFDDNCNQLIDEDLMAGCYTGPEGTIMEGICLPGEMICDQGSWGNVGPSNNFVPGYCKDEITPQEEICNGVDDNCDGITDWGEEIKETDVLFAVDWSGSMTDEINAVMIALNQFAGNFSDEEVLQWAFIKGPSPDPNDFIDSERLEIVQNLTGFTDFLTTVGALDTSLGAMNGTKEMFLDAIYLSVANISTNLTYPIIDMSWLGTTNLGNGWGAKVTQSEPALQDFKINWRPGVQKIMIVFSDEYPQSYLVPELDISDVKNAVAATPQIKVFTFSRAGSDQQKWEQIALAGNGKWYQLSNNPTQMYVSLMEILSEACKPGVTQE